MNSLKYILENLKEEWVTGVEIRSGEYREIFKNPDKGEIRDLDSSSVYRFGGEIRFIADKNKKEVYIASADVVHMVVKDEVGYSLKYFRENCFPAIGNIENGKVKVVMGGDDIRERGIEKKVAEDILNGKYNFLKKYYIDMKSLRDYAEDVLEEV